MVIRDEVLPALIFFNEEEARIVEAMTARIIPGNPGAKEAGAVIYIDRALAGFFSPLQTFYREGIAEFDRLSRFRFGSGFLGLSESQQNEFLRSIEGSLGDERLGKLSQFFAVVYQHTLEGTFGDPSMGGIETASDGKWSVSRVLSGATHPSR
jgi:gluconate 2-dehydrogenase gamma chain